jgi:hypothetical protein
MRQCCPYGVEPLVESSGVLAQSNEVTKKAEYMA